MQLELKELQSRDRHDVRLRHARSGGGDDHVGPDRGHERWDRRAVRDPARALSAAGVSAFVAGFIGTSNLISMRVDRREGGLLVMDLGEGQRILANDPGDRA